MSPSIVFQLLVFILNIFFLYYGYFILPMGGYFHSILHAIFYLIQAFRKQMMITFCARSQLNFIDNVGDNVLLSEGVIVYLLKSLS